MIKLTKAGAALMVVLAQKMNECADGDDEFALQLLNLHRGYDDGPDHPQNEVEKQLVEDGRRQVRGLAIAFEGLLEFATQTSAEVDEDQIWRDAVVGEYTRLAQKPDHNATLEDEQTFDLLNEAIRDSIDIPRMKKNYKDDLGI